MNLIVTQPFKHDGQQKKPGDVIQSFGQQAANLLNLRVVKMSKTYETATCKQQTEKAVKFEPFHIGGGWYELEDGKRVRKAELAGDK